MTKEEVVALGYKNCRQLPDGKWIALHEFIFTYGLLYDITEFSYVCRWCYDKKDLGAAIVAYSEWDGEGDPAGPWVVKK